MIGAIYNRHRWLWRRYFASCPTTELTGRHAEARESELHKQFAWMHAQRGRQLEDIQ